MYLWSYGHKPLTKSETKPESSHTWKSLLGRSLECKGILSEPHDSREGLLTVLPDPVLYAAPTLPLNLVQPLSHFPLNFGNSLSHTNKIYCCFCLVSEVHNSIWDKGRLKSWEDPLYSSWFHVCQGLIPGICKYMCNSECVSGPLLSIG